jgi:hypothetical protein
MMTPDFNHLVGLGFVRCAKKVSKFVYYESMKRKLI